MAQDIRELIKNNSDNKESLREGHTRRFENLLEERLPKQEQKTSAKGGVYLWMKIAAVLIVAGGIVFMVYNNAFAKAGDQQLVQVETSKKQSAEPEVLLSAISPEFKRVEDYYLASVNIEIARLEITDDNKELIDAFMKQLSDLDEEYKSLNREITESGVSDEMVSAMIENLKLRVELMIKLKSKLKEMKNAAQQEAAIQTV